MRLFFFGPRLFGGSIRPGISIGPEDFRKWKSDPAPIGAVPPDAFLYVAKGDENHCKIGITGNPQARLAQLNTGSAHPLEFSWIGIPRDNGALIEQDAHQMLASYRRNGEWFAVTPDAAVGAINAAAQRRGHPILGITLEQAERVRQELIRQEKKPKSWFLRNLVWIMFGVFGVITLMAMFGYISADNQIGLMAIAAAALFFAALIRLWLF